MDLTLQEMAVKLREYPSYRIIRRIGNSRSIVIGGILPLISIVLITGSLLLML